MRAFFTLIALFFVFTLACSSDNPESSDSPESGVTTRGAPPKQDKGGGKGGGKKTQATWYVDSDGDGFGNPDFSQTATSQPAGYVADNTDCNDQYDFINPAAIEICDGYDNDCDGQVDQDWPQAGQSCFKGVGECRTQGVYICTEDGMDVECNAPSPREPTMEICDGIDNDCDGVVDEGFCNIDGVCYTEGETNPENECLECNPSVNSSGWTLVADGSPNSSGMVCCGDQLVDIFNDVANCGACGEECPPGYVCNGGTCVEW